jgi:hypothetical protein
MTAIEGVLNGSLLPERFGATAFSITHGSHKKLQPILKRARFVSHQRTKGGVRRPDAVRVSFKIQSRRQASRTDQVRPGHGFGAHWPGGLKRCTATDADPLPKTDGLAGKPGFSRTSMQCTMHENGAIAVRQISASPGEIQVMQFSHMSYANLALGLFIAMRHSELVSSVSQRYGFNPP